VTSSTDYRPRVAFALRSVSTGTITPLTADSLEEALQERAATGQPDRYDILSADPETVWVVRVLADQ